MSFWQETSPVVKGAIVVGAIGALVGLLALFGVPPFDAGTEAPTTQVRGLQEVPQ